MTHLSFTLFETAIGCCGVVWGERGIVGVALPERSAAATRARVLRRFAGAEEAPPPADVARAIGAMVTLLDGEAVDLSDIALDLDAVAPFNRQVYAIARAIPPGETLTYGEIAARLGEPNVARAVGQAMGLNPCPIIVPCHRVLGSGGKVGGFSANGGVETKMKMLTIERARTSGEPSLFDDLPLAVGPRR